MATSIDAVHVATMKHFRNRIDYFVVKAALSIMSESAGTASHSERVTFANKVFNSDYNLDQYVDAVLTNATVLTNLSATESDNGINDADMEFTVNSFYNAFAGVATV